MFKNVHERLICYSEQKHWLVPLPFAVIGGYYLYRYFGWVDYSPFINGLNFGIHELGHVVMKPCGQFVEILGGTLVQCAVPIVSLFMFLKQDEFLGIPFCFGWFATNCFHVATYVADARSMALPLHGLGTVIIHDWHWLLGRMHLLSYDYAIARGIRYVGFTCLIVCVLGCLFLSWCMFRHKKRRTTSEDDFMKRHGA